MVDKGLILLVEDEPEIAQILDAYLVRDGFRTVRAADGETALTHHSVLSPDLILLDVRIPRLDGFEVLARIRRESNTPTIMVTALAEDLDRLAGLRLGADDYVVKPFNPQEVVARVNAVLRRTRNGAGATILRFENVEVDLDAHAAFIDDSGKRRSLPLTLSEFRILAHMIRRPTHAFDRADILDACLPDSDALARTVDTHVANLRRKLEDLGACGFFTAVRGVGYRFVEPR
ncbi:MULTISPECIES: response regulator [Ensifer]|jgi:two-component system, OmpR family, response regulator AdeR|uniref:response regulator n=1 Tax=Ensifer TaxID=106591 RepID=UPI00042F23F5|nr:MULTISPECIES: response regulator [Ensifer]AHK45459.1 two-component transcriptional regulator [Ensifer adhaerens OV14]MDP9634398.1 two-component system response regulator AdeR [Ensifer adhaerens]KQU85559.1 two-component system response regulator [Ensifer sp. Root31]KQY58025.1 two-component system response regulator [Ensifer sp. Root142]MBD9491904.1 response regulator transcription factor [Ensifer sp. ENS11]